MKSEILQNSRMLLPRLSVITLVLVFARADASAQESAPTAPQDASTDSELSERVNALVRQIDESNAWHWHRTDALVELSAECVPALAAIVFDEERSVWHREIAAEALGRLGDASSLDALRAAEEWARKYSSDRLHYTAITAAARLGDRSSLDRVLQQLATFEETAFGAIALGQYRAQLKYTFGDWASAAHDYKVLMESPVHVRMRARWAFGRAVCLALGGNAPEAWEALEQALAGDPLLALWAETNDDLISLRVDPRFAALLAEAEERIPNDDDNAPPAADASSKNPDLQTPEMLELKTSYEAFLKQHRETEVRLYRDQPHYAKYQRWLRNNYRANTEAARREFAAEFGAVPGDPVQPLIDAQRGWLERLAPTPLKNQAVGDLLETYRRHFCVDELLNAYFSLAAADDRDMRELAQWAHSAIAFARMTGRAAATQSLLANLRDESEDVRIAGRFSLALGHDAVMANDRAAACKHFRHARDVLVGFSGREARQHLEIAERLWPGMPAPDFQVTDIAGKAAKLSDFRGKVVLLDFWATWCGPCVAEMPNVIETYREFHDRGFEIISVSLDESPVPLLLYLQQHEIHWPQICDLAGFEGELAKLYVVDGIPEPILIDREGNLGPREMRGARLKQAVMELLGKQE